MTNVSMPLLGVLGAPVTLACGAFGTTTLLFTLAFPVSALSAYALISRWSGGGRPRSPEACSTASRPTWSRRAART